MGVGEGGGGCVGEGEGGGGCLGVGEGGADVWVWAKEGRVVGIGDWTWGGGWRWARGVGERGRRGGSVE